MSTHINYTMATLTLAGGIIGYAKAKSIPSLVAGTSFALLYTASGVLIEKNPQMGHGMTAVISLILASTMGKRAIKTGKIMPGGLVAGAAAATTIYSAKKYYDWTYGV
ncbi:hypothetical protein SAMD00019534_082560, partial [Acytostelium subglobosum LB1]|uniref:hypothetical protein n=1 Tax=Acytostelium subglobosum LB1 TaxID=1410327 RepID=UPI0006448596